MGNFNRDTNSGRRGGFANRNEIFKATCSSCGRECDLPFKPNGSRPVYCRDCFRKNSPQESGGRRDSFQERGNNADRPMYDAVCANCGDKCKVPFIPREGKDTLCSNCFEQKGGDPRRTNNAQGSMQMADIQAKLDRILELLLPPKTPSKKEVNTSSEIANSHETALDEIVEEILEKEVIEKETEPKKDVIKNKIKTPKVKAKK